MLFTDLNILVRTSFVAVLMLFWSIHVSALEQVPAANAQLEVYGRVALSAESEPHLTWPGSSVEGRFTGTALGFVLDDEKGQNFYNLIIDGKVSIPYVIAAKAGQHSYHVAKGLSEGEHSYSLYKRTEGYEGGTYIKAIILADAGKVLAPPARPARKIAFYGDSVTVGMGNEAPLDGKDDNAAQKNNFLSYAAITARNLKAEQQIIARSGIGLMVSWFDFTMPEYYDQLDARTNNTSTWDFKRWQPDVVVVNLMQNDSWLIDNEKRLAATPAMIVKSYHDFIDKLRALHPDAYFVCVLGSMDATREGSPWPDYIAQAVKQINMSEKGAKKGAKIDTLFFPYEGYGPHPRVQHHQANAERLTTFIQTKMAW